ncbi:hypothetical protein B5X24_HaOG201011 [Helicoverpa armigera]|nr:hypothetical protein B5X24_HaOG201011 [Helicoverpa armigera]
MLTTKTMRQTQNNAEAVSCQILPKNRLEKEIQKIVCSFNFALRLFLVSNYCIKNNHINPNGKIYHTFAFFWMLFMSVLCVYRMFTLEEAVEHLEAAILVNLLFLYYAVYWLGFTVIFIQNLVNRNRIVSLILKIQTIFRSLGFLKDIQSYIIWNYVSLASIVCANIFVHVTFYISWSHIKFIDQIIDNVTNALFVSIHIYTIIAIRVIILLRKFLEEWMSVVNTMNVEHDNNELCLKLFESYKNILEAFNLFKEVFNLLVSNRNVYCL